MTRIILSLFLFLLTFAGRAQQAVEYKGTVKEAGGETLAGAVVMIKDTRVVKTTGADGSFSIRASKGDVLVCSFVGYTTREIALSAQTVLTVELQPDGRMLDELVVVGYGAVKRSDLTAAISSIKSEELIKTSITSLDQGLQGRASGVVVLNTSGRPGGATSIRIRGTSSVMGTNEPLYVIDGVPIINGGTSAGSSGLPSLNPLATINANDVESIEVLKDASAAAIYGARGANGVILVTTKRGAKGDKINVSVNAYYGIQQISRTMDMLNAIQLAELGNEASDNAQITRRPIYADLNNLRKQPSTDWQDEIFRLAPVQSYEASLSGGGEKTSYFLSGNFMSQDGIILGSDYKRGNLRFNIDLQPGKLIKTGVTSNISYNVTNGVVTDTEGAFASSITSWALEMNPALPVHKADGTYVYENNTSNPAVGNPVQDALENKHLTKALRYIGNIYAELTVIDGLSLKTSFGIDYFNVKEQSFAPSYLSRSRTNNGFAGIGLSDGYTWIWDNTLSFNRTFAEKHSVNAVAGFTAQQFSGENAMTATADFEDNRLGYHSIQTGKLRQIASSGYSGWQMLSYLARVNYSFDHRYMLSLSGRIDGSSKFGANHRYGFFPSASAAWRVSEEEFMKNIDPVSNLKLRLSYGITGNEGIGAYSSQGLLFSTEAYVGSDKIIKGQGPYSLPNKDLRWETTSQFNAGVDFGLFRGRLSFTADFYIKQTRDLLLYVPVPVHSGFDLSMKNIGSLENRGFELAVNAVPFAGNKFSWESNFTLGFNHNKVIDLFGSEEGLSGSSINGINYWTRITEGKAIGTIYGYKTEGIVQLGENLSQIPYFPAKEIGYGDRKYVDKSKDNKLNEEDYFDLGNANPDFAYGWNNTFSYNFGNKCGALHLTVYLQGVYGNSIANFNLFALESFDGGKNNSTIALERWTPNNPTNAYPRANATSPTAIFSDHQVEDGSYLRVKDLTLAYDIPARWLERLSISAVQIYLSGKNMFTFTSYSGYDPEVSRFGTNNLSMGADFGSYPVSKIYMIGLKANF